MIARRLALGCAALVAVLSASCFSSGTTTCGDLTCPKGTVCAPDGARCVQPDQITACQGKSVGDACEFGTTPGACFEGGVCYTTGCGNGILEPGEVCDDGNRVSGDGCSADCKSNETCGNGIVDVNEGCDAGSANSDAPDAPCRPDCTPRRCGDGIVDPMANEDCEGVATGANCNNFGFYGGTLSCSSTCRYDTTTCVGKCGDGILNGLEQCDGAANTGANCQTFGFHVGMLACNSECIYDTSGCSERCGDGVLDPTEQCEGTQLGGATCESQGFYGGVLGCTSGCVYDTSACSGRCNDGVLQPADEQCDGMMLGSGTCQTNGFYTGTLSCTAGCTYDTAGCSGFCNDGILQTGFESCDGALLNGKTCTDFGFYTGTLACTTGCAFDTGNCHEICGDGIKNGPEQCDKPDLGLDKNGVTTNCTDFGFYAAAGLTCTTACGYDTSACGGGFCGDGIAQAGHEQCDGSDLAGATCLTFGFYSASGLSCASGCGYDTSGCRGYCGDDVVTDPPELCDGIPAGSCLDGGFDMGTMGCSGACAADFGGCRQIGWRKTDSGTTNDLSGAWAASPTRVFLVGNAGTVLVGHGTIWTAMTSSTTQNLTAVWASSPSDVFAVGANGTIVHYDGTSWSPQSSNTTQNLFAVWGSSSSDVFAVGSSGTIVHYNGTAWSAMTSGTTVNLRGVWGTASNNVFVVGDGGTIRRFTTSWAAMTSNTTQSLYAIGGSAGTDVYAVGTGGTVDHFDGTTWTVTATLAPTTQILRGVTATSAGGIALASDSGSIFQGATTTWTNAGIANGNPLAALTAPSTGEIYAVGQAGTMVRYTNSSWAALVLAASSNVNLESVWASSASNIVTVGTNATIWMFSAGVWSNPSANSAGTIFFGVWGAAANNVFAVGVNGTGGVIDHWNGSTWSASTATPQLQAVWGSAATDIYAVGLGGAILHSTNGTSWAAQTSGTTSDLFAVWGSSSSNVFVAGAGVILHNTGSGWTPLPGVPKLGSYVVRSIWGTSPTSVYFVGQGGLILHWDGTFVTQMVSGTTNNLYSVAGELATTGSGPADLFAVGTSGLVLHYDGRAWAPVNAGVGSNFLFGVWSSAGSTVAVGQNLEVATLTRTGMPCTGTELACDDGYDNDCDGATDAADSDCTAKPVEQCGNQIDDNGDGLVDCADRATCGPLKGCQDGGLCKDAGAPALALACPGTTGTPSTRSDTTVGAAARLDGYGCVRSLEAGPEMYYAFSSPVAKTVTVTLTGYTGDLDLVVIGDAGTPPADACDPFGKCITASATTAGTETVTFSAAAGATYYLAVDGFTATDASAYTITVSSCL